MLFTRTIRRTMVCGLAMVLCMIIGLSLSAIYSHLSYGGIIGRLHFAFNRCPRKTELLDSLVALQSPLLPKFQNDPAAFRFQHSKFLEALDEAHKNTNRFLLDLDLLPQDPEIDQSSKPVARDQALRILDALGALSKRAGGLIDRKMRDEVLLSIKSDVANLQVLARQIPDFQRGIRATIEDAHAVIRRGFWLVVGSGAVSVLFLSALIAYGYIWVFAPLRKLHQGALRVAQGDFNYRLAFSRQDEMKELADAFNSMTSRFQAIACDLDRQVCERSKQLIRSERLANIGLLAAGVAHEINNPLSAIAMAAESLTDRLSDGAAGSDADDGAVTRQYLEMIQREAFRCQRITQKLLDFARGNGDTRARHDLTAIVSDVLGVVRHMSRYYDRSIRFSPAAPCWLEINGPEIQQVVLNLVSNGLEAMDSGGTMTIEISEQTDQVTLCVSDDGCGMTPEVIENLFEPFFTRRRNGRGTGLGLSISHRIVTDHGGSVEVESSGLGRGSTFRVRLPRRPAKRDAAA